MFFFVERKGHPPLPGAIFNEGVMGYSGHKKINYSAGGGLGALTCSTYFLLRGIESLGFASKIGNPASVGM